MKTEIKKEDIKSVVLEWDWNEISIPNNKIQKLIYEEEKSNGREIWCNFVSIEIDLSFMQEDNRIEKIQEKNIWNVAIIRKNNEEFTLTLPSYRKDSYCGEAKEIDIAWKYENLCEQHEVKGNTFLLQWNELKEQEIYMNEQEMSKFFQKGNLSSISKLTHPLLVEFLKRIIEQNEKESSIFTKIEALSKKDNKPTIHFSNLGESIIHIKQQIENAISHRMKGYKIEEKYEPIYGQDRYYINVKNRAHHWNFNFIFLTELKNLEKIICEIEPNADTKNYFSRNILVFKDNVNIEETMLDLYRKIYSNRDNIEIENETLLVTTYSKINQMWYHIHKEWNLL